MFRGVVRCDNVVGEEEDLEGEKRQCERVESWDEVKKNL
jgi:hypothetical protein